MPAIEVGTRIVYHDESGEAFGEVVEYVEGREHGDYLIAGFSNEKLFHEQGPVWRFWTVFGEEQGAFSVA